MLERPKCQQVDQYDETKHQDEDGNILDPATLFVRL